MLALASVLERAVIPLVPELVVEQAQQLGLVRVPLAREPVEGPAQVELVAILALQALVKAPEQKQLLGLVVAAS